MRFLIARRLQHVFCFPERDRSAISYFSRMFWVSPPFSVAKRKPGYLYGWQQKCVIVMTTAKLGRHKFKKIEAAAVELRP